MDNKMTSPARERLRAAWMAHVKPADTNPEVFDSNFECVKERVLEALRSADSRGLAYSTIAKAASSNLQTTLAALQELIDAGAVYEKPCRTAARYAAVQLDEVLVSRRYRASREEHALLAKYLEEIRNA